VPPNDQGDGPHNEHLHYLFKTHERSRPLDPKRVQGNLSLLRDLRVDGLYGVGYLRLSITREQNRGQDLVLAVESAVNNPALCSHAVTAARNVELLHRVAL
jgi:hypothetical protein